MITTVIINVYNENGIFFEYWSAVDHSRLWLCLQREGRAETAWLTVVEAQWQCLLEGHSRKCESVIWITACRWLCGCSFPSPVDCGVCVCGALNVQPQSRPVCFLSLIPLLLWGNVWPRRAKQQLWSQSVPSSVWHLLPPARRSSQVNPPSNGNTPSSRLLRSLLIILHCAVVSRKCRGTNVCLHQENSSVG